MKSLLVIGLLTVSLLGGVAGAGGAATAPVAQHSVVVTGNGAVATVPDRARLSFGVSNSAKTASAALRANATEMSRVIAALKDQGIAAADVRTELVSLSPRYSSNGDAIVGYAASNSAAVTLRNLEKVGSVIDATVDAGANQVSGPNLVRSDQSALYRRALRAAIVNARAKAQTIARASGLRLRRVTDVSEAGGPTPLAETTKAGAADATPVEPGTQLVEATVTVTFSVA
jgi:uncharacterized protein YggE